MSDAVLRHPANHGTARKVAPGAAWLALPIVNVYLLGEPGAGDRG